MLVSRAIKGNIHHSGSGVFINPIEYLELEWFDTTKRIIRAYSTGGKELGFSNLDSVALEDGDVLYDADGICIVVRVLPCSCIVFEPQSIKEMAIACFEIGNKHIPIFINDQNEVITAFEKPLFDQLKRAGFQPMIEERVIERTDVLKMHQVTNFKNKIILVKED